MDRVIDWEFEQISPEDIQYFMNILDSVAPYLQSGLQGSAPVATYIYIPIEQIRLEDLLSSVHGITDIPGQIKSWIYDRMMELSTWFAGVVNGLWNDTIKPWIQPWLDKITDIKNYIVGIPGQISGILSDLGKVFTKLSDIWSTVTQLGSKISNIFTSVGDFLRELPTKLSDVWDKIKGLGTAISSAFDAVRNFLTVDLPKKIQGVWDALGELGSAISSAIDGIRNFVTVELPAKFKVVSDAIGVAWNKLQEFGNWIANAINTVRNFFFVDLPNKMKEVWSFISSIPEQLKAVPDAIGKIWIFLTKDLPAKLADVGTFLAGIPAKLSGVGEALDKVRKFFFEDVPNAIKGIWNFLTVDLPKKMQEVWSFLASIPERLKVVPEVIGKIWNFLTVDLPKKIQEVWSFITSIPERLKVIIDALDRVRKFLFEDIPNAFATAGNKIKELGDAITNAFNIVKTFITVDLPTKIGSAWEEIKTKLSEAKNTISEFFDKVKQGIIGLPQVVESLLTSAFLSPLQLVNAVYNWIVSLGISHAIEVARIETLRRDVRSMKTILSSLFGTWMFTDGAGIGLDPIDLKKYAEEILRDMVKRREITEDQAKEIMSRLEPLIPGRQWALDHGLLSEDEAIREIHDAIAVNAEVLKGVPLADAITKVIEEREKVGAPVAIPNPFQPVIDFFSWVWTQIQSFVSDPGKWITDNIISPLWSGLQWLGGKIVKGLQWLWDNIVSGLKWLGEKIVDVFTTIGNAVQTAVVSGIQGIASFLESVANSVKKFATDFVNRVFIEPFKGLAQKIGNIFLSAFKSPKGELELIFSIAGEFLVEYYAQTLPIYFLSGLAGYFGDLEIVIEPEILGSKGGGVRWKLNTKELVEGFLKALKEFYPSFLMGTFMGISSALMSPVTALYKLKFIERYKDRAKEMFEKELEEEIKKGARIDIFVEAPTLTDLREWIRRQIGAKGKLDMKEISPELSTYLAHLRLRGLPQWFIEYLTDMGEKLKIEFKDRFGVTRKMLLGEVFELPTHSEMARMTQRDIFPGVDVMKRLGWIRGWNEDLTTMIYLMTFKYPSFDKLWQFYMRALSGMLWFSPPSTITSVFAREAQEVGAGIPISPLDLQNALAKRGPDAVTGFETALNTYFKWIEYSNFSWFTPNTEMYGIKIGQEIYSRLGGWTADSWIMADLSAEIPGRIDMRWMSRYGIFQLMSDKLGKIADYTPMVTVVPKIMDSQAVSTIQVDLTYFSRLLQATGLHPAWVPIVTVAENIMAISDEMTLLRTGWINLYKEGILKMDDMQKFLAGLFVVSYRVGYWNPTSKTWTDGYINLPVRWLPHERVLLGIRAVIDRAMDIYRESYRYLIGGVARYAISPDDAKKSIETIISSINQSFFTKVIKDLTGKELSLTLDEGYWDAWIEYAKKIQDVEAIERIRSWWFRVSGWILYRVAQGYVTKEDMEKVVSELEKTVPIHPKEKEAYLNIISAIYSIVIRERYPSPSQLATLAEYVTIDEKLIDTALKMYMVPNEFIPIWKEYIMRKPLFDEIKSLLSAYYKAKVYRIRLNKEVEDAVNRYMKIFGLTDEEKAIRSLTVAITETINEYLRYRQLFEPTISFIATIAEYVDIWSVKEYRDYIEGFFNKLAEIGIPSEMYNMMRDYIDYKPVKSDYRSLLTVALRAFRLGIIEEKKWKEYLERAKNYGFTSREIALLQERATLEVLIEESREYIPTPSMLATMSEYITIPKELIEKVFKARRIPEEWQDIWAKYIAIRPLADDVRALLTSYLRVLKYGVSIPEDLDKQIKSFFTLVGITDTELKIRELVISLETMIESLPTLSQLATMSEYIEIPIDYIKKILEARRVEKTFAELWIRYIQVRMISSEVNALVSTFRRIYEYFAPPEELYKQVMDIMKQGGWTSAEIKIFQLDLELRKQYRIVTYLIPSIRQFLTDGQYIPNYMALLEDLFKARGIELDKYKQQLEYYKKLLKNRRLWRHFSWYRTQLMYAYQYGAISKDEVIKRLQKFKDMGLVDDDEINMIVEGMDLRKAYYQAYRSQYYGS